MKVNKTNICYQLYETSGLSDNNLLQCSNFICGFMSAPNEDAVIRNIKAVNDIRRSEGVKLISAVRLIRVEYISVIYEGDEGK